MRRRALLSTTALATLTPPTLAAASPTAAPSGDAASRVSTMDATGVAAARPEPPSIEPLASIEVERAADVNVDDAGETAYVTTKTGLVVVDVADPADPVVLTRLDPILEEHPDGPLDYVRNATVDGDRLLLTAHALGSVEDGNGAIVLYDVADPASPERLAVHETEYPVHNGDIAGDVAVATKSLTDRWPVVVLDVTDDLAELSRWSVLDAAPEWSDVDRSIRRLHDVSLRGDTAYLAYWDAGGWLLDLSDPTAPEPIRQLGGRDPAVVAESTERPIVETLELPGNVTAIRPNDDETLVAWSKEGDGSTTRDVPRWYSGGLDVWHVDGERAVTIAAPAVEAQARWSKNFGWRGDRIYVAWRDAGVAAYDLADPAAPLNLGVYSDVGDDDFHTARPIADGFVGLTFRGEPDAGPTNHLFTFPEPSGDDAVPARTRADDLEPPTSTTTRRPTTAARTTDPGAATTVEASTTTTGTATATESTETTRDDDEQGTTTTDAGNAGPTPGFGATAALAASGLATLAAAARALGRSNDGSDGE